MNELLSAAPEADWEEVAPQLDAALGELSEPDRDAVLLSYFQRKSAREMAQTLGTSEEAAQRRVSRAVERLRELLAKRGVTAGAGGLAVLIGANAVEAAPAGLALSVSSSVAVAGAALATVTTSTAAKAIAMTTLQKTLLATTLAAAIAGADRGAGQGGLAAHPDAGTGHGIRANRAPLQGRRPQLKLRYGFLKLGPKSVENMHL